MLLANTTALDARVDVAPQPGLDVRVGLLIAKATFRWDDRGEVALDGQRPVPIFIGDEPTPRGVLPRDDLPDRGDAFEVVVLGTAHAPEGAPITERTVAFEIGGERRELLVIGDRTWEGEGDGAVISSPAPFTTMPIGWDRAFGGSIEVEIDEGSTVPVVDVRNPAGRGFDPAPMAAGLGESLRCPPPFPRWSGPRPLPNVESSDRRIARWSDTPDPAGWGAVPTSWAIAQSPYRAAPGCVLDGPPQDGRIALEGLAPGAPVSLRVPPMEVVTDAAVGTRRTTRALRLARWVIDADERTITATYRLAFSLQRAKGERGSMRLRLEGGGG
jgi:hypothetical protein